MKWNEWMSVMKNEFSERICWIYVTELSKDVSMVGWLVKLKCFIFLFDCSAFFVGEGENINERNTTAGRMNDTLWQLRANPARVEATMAADPKIYFFEKY